MALKINFQPTSADTLRATLDDFEQRYGVTSDRLADAFKASDGKLRETQDFLDWTHTYEAWRLLVSG